MEFHKRSHSTDLEDTAQLIRRAKAGDRAARDTLFCNYYPHLLVFLHNKLSSSGRRIRETQDLVHEVFVRAFPSLDRFTYLGIGAFWAFLRKIAVNHLRQVWSHHLKRGSLATLQQDSHQVPAANTAGPSEIAQKREEFEAYESAVSSLKEREREALLMRIELGLPYKTIADELEYPSPDAARMTIVRASKKLYREMHRGA